MTPQPTTPPRAPAEPSTGNPDLLRQAITAGKTLDKVRFCDPSAAPLGTDDEAAGQPVSVHAVAECLRLEVSDPSATPGNTHFSESPIRRSGVICVFFLPFLAVVAAIALALAR